MSVTVSFLVIMFHIVLVVLLIRVIVTVCSGLGAAVDVILGVLVGVMVGIMVGVDSVSDLVVKGMDCGSSEIVSGPEFVIIGVVPTGSEADVVAIVGSSSDKVKLEEVFSTCRKRKTIAHSKLTSEDAGSDEVVE